MRLVRRLLVTAAAMVAVSVPFITPASAAGNDYPWRYDSSWSADPFGFTKRQCVSFAAWEMAQRRHPIYNTAATQWGSAYNWDNAAARLQKHVWRTPRVGTVAQWNAYERSAYYSPGSTRPNGYTQAGPYGHVAVVTYVYGDGSVRVEQYNMSGNRSYSTMRVKAPRYLYI